MGVDRDSVASDLEVKAFTERDSGLDARQCLLNIEEQFNAKSEYFTFTKVGEESGFIQWFVRIPRPEKQEIHVWLRDFDHDLIHVCRPIEMWRAIQENQIQRVPAFSGYVVDDACHRCKREVPEEAVKRVRWFMHRNQKVLKDI